MGNENTQVSANLTGIKFITFLLLKLLTKPLNTERVPHYCRRPNFIGISFAVITLLRNLKTLFKKRPKTCTFS